MYLQDFLLGILPLSIQPDLASGARFRSGNALKVDLGTHPFQIELSDGSQIEAESLIIATGASPKWLGIPNEQELIGKGVSANALLDGPKLCE